MSQIKATRKIYDSVFTDLFRSAENQLRLYKDLHPEDKDVTAGDIRNVTIKPILTDQLYNDLGFTVKDKTILLVEAQSKWCPNMALRALLYLAESFRAFMIESGQDVYSSRNAYLPKPELYVLYTGEVKHGEKELSLADTFWHGDNSVVDIKVKVLYGEEPDAILSQYTEFTRIYRKWRAIYGPTRTAVEATIEECISNNILADYLSERRAEVVDIMMWLFDDEVIKEMHENSLVKQGVEKGKFESVDQLVVNDILDEEKACDVLGVDIEAYRNYAGCRE